MAALYGFLREREPRQYVEIGSGVSTLCARRAIQDGGLATRITSIDPQPRADVDAACDHVIRAPLEQVDLGLFDDLGEGDIVFMDGSHHALANSDTVAFFLDVLPALPDGVLVGVHDILLPDDYPPEWADFHWSEQYLVAAYLLARGDQVRVELPCSYVHAHSELVCHPRPRLAHSGPRGAPPHGSGAVDDHHRAGRVLMATQIDVNAEIQADPFWYHTIEVAPGVTTPGWFDLRPVVDLCPGPTYAASGAWTWAPPTASWPSSWSAAARPRWWPWTWPTTASGIGPRTCAPAAAVHERGHRAREGRRPAHRPPAAGLRRPDPELSTYDISPETVGEFDVVVCGSLLLHLRDPMRALAAIRSVCREAFLCTNQVELRLSVLGRDIPRARLHSSGPDFQWWVPNPVANRDMVTSVGFSVGAPDGDLRDPLRREPRRPRPLTPRPCRPCGPPRPGRPGRGSSPRRTGAPGGSGAPRGTASSVGPGGSSGPRSRPGGPGRGPGPPRGSGTPQRSSPSITTGWSR